MAIVCYIFVSDEPPSDVSVYFESEADKDRKKEDKEPIPKDQTPSFSDVIFLPSVLSVGLSYFFLKFLRYALLFWLPYYYEHSLGYSLSLAGYLSTSFEFGGAIGTPLIGYISDYYMNGKRDYTAAVFMLLSCFSLSACILFSGEVNCCLQKNESNKQNVSIFRVQQLMQF